MKIKRCLTDICLVSSILCTICCIREKHTHAWPLPRNYHQWRSARSFLSYVWPGQVPERRADWAEAGIQVWPSIRREVARVPESDLVGIPISLASGWLTRILQEIGWASESIRSSTFPDLQGGMFWNHNNVDQQGLRSPVIMYRWSWWHRPLSRSHTTSKATQSAPSS